MGRVRTRVERLEQLVPGSASNPLNNTGVAAGTYGDSTHVGQFTVGLDGRLTSASSVAITGGGGLSVGLDKDRPAAATVGFYKATDSGLTYVNDGTTIRVENLPEKSAYSGLSDSSYFISGAGTTVGPTLASPYTILVGIHIVSAAAGSDKVMVGFSDASTTGWYMALLLASSKIGLFMAGLNGGAYNQFAGMTALTTGPHLIAISYDGTNLKLVADAGGAVTLTPSGSYSFPSAFAQVCIGRYIGGTGNSFNNGGVFLIHGYAAALSTGDMQTLTATPSDYFPGGISQAVAYGWSSKIPTSILGFKTWGNATATDGTANLSVVGSPQLRTF